MTYAKYCLILITLTGLSSCGRAYFPIELDTRPRAERSAGQQNFELELISLDKGAVKIANKTPYVRLVKTASSFDLPATHIEESKAIRESIPADPDPGPYVIGVGDVVTLIGENNSSNQSITVSDEGYIYVPNVGGIKALGLTQSELDAAVYEKSLRESVEISPLVLTGFKSKKIYSIMGEKVSRIAYGNSPIFLLDVMALLTEDFARATIRDGDVAISIKRGVREYTVSLKKLLEGKLPKIRVLANDKIILRPLNYKKEVIYIVGETKDQISIPINPEERPSLADTLFNSNPVFETITSDFSQIYVIRKKKNDLTLVVYHLDITNPARINLANIFEMRPDDIVFVATQPLSLYSRTLSQILGSTGLTIQARDAVRREVKN